MNYLTIIRGLIWIYQSNHCIIIRLIFYIFLMAGRLALLVTQIAQTEKMQQPSFIGSSFDYLKLGDYLTADQNKLRKEVREFVEQQIVGKIVPYVQKGTFPSYLIPLLRQRGFNGHFFIKPYGFGSRSTLQGVMLAEFARGDAGVAMMILLGRLLGEAIVELGSEEQKSRYMEGLVRLERTTGLCKEEKEWGKMCSAEKTMEGYRITGVKNVLGMGIGDTLCTMVKNSENGQLQCFLIDNEIQQGAISQAFSPKLTLRILSNYRLSLNGLQIPQSQRLPNSPGTTVTSVFNQTLVMVCWLMAGICMGVYDNSIRYASARHQFNRPISGFQLVQQKLVKIMSATQGVLLMCFRLSGLMEEGKAEWGRVAMGRGWIGHRARQVCRWGREIGGGNGVLHENYVMRALADVQALTNFLAASDVSMLIAAFGLTQANRDK